MADSSTLEGRVDRTSEVARLLGTVADVMERRVVVLSPATGVGQAARELERVGVSGAPVIEDHAVVGIVTLDDLFRTAKIDPRRVATSGPWHRYEFALDATGLTVADAMTKAVLTLPPMTTVAEAAAVMRANRVNRIPVVDDRGELVGIVTRDDVVGAVAGVANASEPVYPGAPLIGPD